MSCYEPYPDVPRSIERWSSKIVPNLAHTSQFITWAPPPNKEYRPCFTLHTRLRVPQEGWWSRGRFGPDGHWQTAADITSIAIPGFIRMYNGRYMAHRNSFELSLRLGLTSDEALGTRMVIISPYGIEYDLRPQDPRGREWRCVVLNSSPDRTLNLAGYAYGTVRTRFMPWDDVVHMLHRTGCLFARAR